jgi:hypothetical protein
VAAATAARLAVGAPAPAVRDRRMVAATSIRKVVEFYTMELAQLADGTFHVSLTATTVDDEEPQLLCQEIASERVVSIDDALAVIKQGVTGTNPRS